MSITQKQRRAQQLGWEIMAEEYECEMNPCRSQTRLSELKAEQRRLNIELDRFYADPMTEYAGI